MMQDGGTFSGRESAKIAGEWDGGSAKAAVLLDRPDVVKAKVTRQGGVLSSRLLLSEPLRRRPEGSSATLPGRTLLLLDDSEALHLFEVVTEKLRLRLGDEVKKWSPDEAAVTILPGKGAYRAVEISDSADRLLLAAPFKGAKKKQALELIAQAA